MEFNNFLRFMVRDKRGFQILLGFPAHLPMHWLGSLSIFAFDFGTASANIEQRTRNNEY